MILCKGSDYHRILTVCLFSGELLNVNSPSLSVDRLDLALSALVSTSQDFDSITLADGDSAYVVLGSQILRQMAAQDLSSEVRWCGKVSLS